MIVVAETNKNDPKHNRLYNVHQFIFQTVDNKEKSKLSFIHSVLTALRTTFLPVGYPASVRPEYLTYQFWDSLQGISSYLRSVLTTKALLQGAGVGVTDATALSAALVWVTKDGIGMIGSLVFAYHCADLFEVNVKEWRLLADALNNFGLTLDLCASMFPPSFFLLVTSVSTLSKSLCGLIAGATKARISAHFALKGHLADITAKESTQETAVALVGLVVGMVCASYVAEDVAVTWGVFIVLLLLHQWANYQLIRVLVLDTLNPQRIHIITKRCLEASTKDTRSSSHSPIPSPAPSSFPSPNDVAHAERLFVPIWLHWRGPRIGCPLLALFPAHLACNALGVYKGDHQGDNGEAARQHWERLRGLWEGQGFVVGVGDDGQAVACLGDDCGDAAMVKAYFVCCYLHEHWGAHTSPPQRLASLTELAPEALAWFHKDVWPGLSSAQSPWDVSEGTPRLGPGPWRFQISTSSSATHSKAKDD